MANKLPKITYNAKGIGKRRCVVDFRLAELRCPIDKTKREFKAIKFEKMPEGKQSKIKKKLRGLRFRTWHQDYIKGLDD